MTLSHKRPERNNPYNFIEESPTNDTGKARPDLPSLAYDTQFGTAGKLRLPLEDRTGWASCILSSTTHPSMYLVGFYEVLKPVNPPSSYLSRIARLDQTGTLDASFGGGQGFIDASFAPDGITIIKGMHETKEGGIFIWGTATVLAAGAFSSNFFLSKKLQDGQPDMGFGLNGLLDLSSLFPNFGIQWVPGRSCVFASDGSIFAAVARADTPVSLITKVTSAGILDTQFQNKGMLTVTNDGKATYLHGLTIEAEDGVIGYGATTSDTAISGVIMKYDSAGYKNKEFGKGGSVELSDDRYSSFAENVHIMQDNRLIVTGHADTLRDSLVVTESLITLLTPDGRLDKPFNAGKPAVHRFSENSDFDFWDMATPQLEKAGKIIAVGSGGPEGSTGPVVGRFNSDGTLDHSLVAGSPFGTLQDASFFSSQGYEFINTQADQILVVGNTNNRPVVLALKV